MRTPHSTRDPMGSSSSRIPCVFLRHSDHSGGEKGPHRNVHPSYHVTSQLIQLRESPPSQTEKSSGSRQVSGSENSQSCARAGSGLPDISLAQSTAVQTIGRGGRMSPYQILIYPPVSTLSLLRQNLSYPARLEKVQRARRKGKKWTGSTEFPGPNSLSQPWLAVWLATGLLNLDLVRPSV